MSPRPDVRDARRSQILNGAERIFAKKGFSEARMEDIAKETGLSKGTLYLYFKSKDDLIIAILNRIFQREFLQIEHLKQDEASATRAIWTITDRISRDFLDLLRVIPIVYNYLALAFSNKYVQRALKDYFHRYLNVLVPIIQRGIDSGEFRSVDAVEVAIAMGAMVEGTILMWTYDSSMVDPEDQIRAGMKHLLEGVQARP